jgi:hypothetical protein
MVCVMSWACCSASFCGSAAVKPSSKLVQWLVSAHACSVWSPSCTFCVPSYGVTVLVWGQCGFKGLSISKKSRCSCIAMALVVQGVQLHEHGAVD